MGYLHIVNDIRSIHNISEYGANYLAMWDFYYILTYS